MSRGLMKRRDMTMLSIVKKVRGCAASTSDHEGAAITARTHDVQ